VVNNNNDGGAGSLRAVIANACPGSTITFASSVVGTINLTSGELLIDKNLTINGPGANLLTVQRSAAAGNFRIFHITSGGFNIISGLTIANGNPADFGGGIYNQNGGALTVTGCAISGNSAIKNGVFPSSGGGIYNFNSTLTLINSTISGNNATGSGGGIDNNNGLLTVTNSTISGNFASTGDGGGGIYNGAGTANLANSTISGNSTNRSGGGINNSIGTVNVRNTIIAGNTATSSGPDFNGALTSQDFNLIGNASGATINPAQTSDQIGNAGSPINPLLGSLANNGGPTPTHALLAGSTAINRGDSSGSITDQRGFTRAVGSSPPPYLGGGDGGDIGAFEAQAPSAVTLVGFTAIARDNSVLINWQTGFEVSNLGFYIQRDDGSGAPARITDLIAGSALFAGASTSLTAGRDYSWRDKRPFEKGTRYYLEEVDLDGTSRFHGPVFVEATGDRGRGTADEAANSPTVSELNESDSVQQAPSPLEPKAKLRKPNEASLQVQGLIASQPALKFAISAEGLYRVTRDELVSAGLDPNTDPRRLQLFVDGKELAMQVAGEEDGKLDAVDYIEFYGIGINSNYSNSRVYWLTAGASAGRRIGNVSGPEGKLSPSSFAYTVERKDRTIYFASLLNGDAENFFGPVIAGSSISQPIFAPQVANLPGVDATIEIALQGVTSAVHLVRIDLNGFEVGRLSFNGQAHSVKSIMLSQSLLHEGANTFTLTRLGDNSDISLVDYLRLTYQHAFVADNDSLRITCDAGEKLSIADFSSDKVRAFDVTDFGKVQEVEAKAEPSKSNGGYVLTFNAPGSGSRTLLAVADSQLKHAVAFADQPSSWRTRHAGVDFVIITRHEFLPALEPLRALRHGQGLSVAVVDVEDIYDEFSYGQKTPQAVQDFLSFATAYWKTPPRYLLFAGDASLDPKNYLGLGDFDFVPTKLIDTNYLEAASDDWFASFSGETLASMSIGRLPFRTLSEASTMIKKIVGYELSSPLQEALLVADANDGFNFELASDQLRPLIPADLRVQQINRGRVDAATAKSQLLAAIARGQKVVNYTGHGSANQWRGNLLTGDEARALRNGDRLPLFVMMTCLNGYFQDAAVDSLAESLLKSEAGGAIAVWGSSGMTLPGGQAVLNQEFFRSIFGSGRAGPMMLGDAILRAKAAVSDTDIRRTWVLLGDPTMRLR
ncbi:MAG TPA: C25 family cysteine peptidase, partial [Blastocatellia bacterium]|nr:C25 family cysteine peptidase [Blastocatellia bacterium]